MTEDVAGRDRRSQPMPDDLFDIAWAPERYPMYNENDTGRWRHVIADGRAVGLVWSSKNGAGVLWIKQTSQIEQLHRHFLAAASMKVKPHIAYQTSWDVGATFSGEYTGMLSEATVDMHVMMEKEEAVE